MHAEREIFCENVTFKWLCKSSQVFRLTFVVTLWGSRQSFSSKYIYIP